MNTIKMIKIKNNVILVSLIVSIIFTCLFLMINISILSSFNLSSKDFGGSGLLISYKIIYYFLTISCGVLFISVIYKVYIEYVYLKSIDILEYVFIIVGVVTQIIYLFTTNIYLQLIEEVLTITGGKQQSLFGMANSLGKAIGITSGLTTFRKVLSFILILISLVCLGIALFYAKKRMSSDIDLKEKGLSNRSINILSNKEFFKRVFTKKFMIISGSILGAIVIIFSIFLVFSNNIDAEVSTKDIDFKVHYKGYDKYATAKCDVKGHAKVINLNNSKKQKEIEEIIKNPIVEISKNKDLTNGDEIKITLTFKDVNGIKIKYDNKKIEKTVKVSNLPVIVTSQNDISKEDLEKLEKNMEDKILDRFLLKKGLKISKLKSLEKIPTLEDLKNKSQNPNKYEGYNLVNIYKVTSEKLNKERVVIMKASDIEYHDGKLICSIKPLPDGDLADRTISSLESEGFKEVGNKG